MAIDTRKIPSTKLRTVMEMKAASPLIVSAGENTKANGMTYASQPVVTEFSAVCIGSACAMPAAVNAATATGGVIMDIMP